MTYYTEINEDSFLKRNKIKRDLIKILRRHGFKRSFLKFWTHPASEVYVKGDFKAKVYSKIEHDTIGSPERGIPPYDYGVAGVEIDGPAKDSEIVKELHAYGEKPEKEHTKKREQKTSGIEKKFGVFVAFIIGGVALSLGSLTITGNVVSNLTQTTPGLLGVFLFIAGLVGMFFYSKRK